ncbi:MAG: circularly permuted type 2 ATP-grasp protein [Sulfuricurvum sp.]|nr:circularly permuted type 2 ATP-grasp protein [Sulfuricurvum sp.]
MMFEQYKSSSYDEMFDENGVVREHWKPLAANLEELGCDQLEAKRQEIDWRLEDNGVTYNVYNDPNGMSRPWSLDPIPLILESSDWKNIEEGVRQRATLMNLLFKDIYGEQRILKEDIIPCEVIFPHSGFLREAHGLFDHLDYPMMMVAVDLARGPDGKMWVVSDRTQAPSGLGYAVENRLTMNSAMQVLYKNISIRRLHVFFDSFKTMLLGLGKNSSREPLNVLLSPGPHNETYFEHAYLSSFLGLTLVQGQDLLAKGGALWLKSLKGLRRIDAIVRRVDESYCDPLELRADSKLGVSGLVQVLRKKGVSMANPLGAGVLENLGLYPFLPILARYFLNEELILPQIATWWCGQDKERDYVLKNLSTLVIKTIDRNADEPSLYVGKNLSSEELEVLRQKIQEQPYRYVGQEEVQFATAPTFIQGEVVPRKVVIRSFAIKAETSYEVMPGALVRVGSSDDALAVSGQVGGSSKDLWISSQPDTALPSASTTQIMSQSMGQDSMQSMSQMSLQATAPMAMANVFKARGGLENSLENIPTLRAENLFWLGRYLMRSITSARMIRMTLKSLANSTRYNRNGDDQVQEILCSALTHLSMTYPGFLGIKDQKITDPLSEIWSVMSDSTRVGSLSQVIMMLSNASTSTKNLLPLEGWRIFDRLSREWSEFTHKRKPAHRDMIAGVDKLLVHLMAYKALIEETLFAEQGLVLYDIGARLERSSLLIAKARAMLTSVYEPFVEYEILETLLGTSESLNAYRAHYRSSIEFAHVSEFLLLDIHFPKSLISEINQLLKALPKLPKFKHEMYLSRYEQPLFEAFSLLRLERTENLCVVEKDVFIRDSMDALLSSIADKLIVSADELSKTYFSHYDE